MIRAAHPVGRWLNAGLLLWLVLLPAFLYLTPGELWTWEFRGLPPVPILAGLVAGVVVVLRFGTYEHRRLCNLLIAGILGGMSLSVRVQPLGDYGFWCREAANPFIGASEPLTNLIYHGVFLLGGREALGYVTPIAGVVFASSFLSLCDTLFLDRGDADSGPVKKLCCLSFLAASWQPMFARGYIENPQLSLPFLLLAVGALVRYSSEAGKETGLPPTGCGRDLRRRASSTDLSADPHRRRSLQLAPSLGLGAMAGFLPSLSAEPGRSPRRQFLLAAGWLAVACMFHGVSAALLPAMPLIAWLFPPRGRTADQRSSDVLWALLLFAAIAGVTIGTLLGLGFYMYQGNLHWYMFMPLAPVTWAPTTLQSAEHFRFVANLLLLASPLVVALPLLLLSRAGRRGFAVASLRYPGLLILTLGYCGFTFVFYFALGFPKDFDLMFGLGVLLHLHLVQGSQGLLGSRAGRWLLLGALLVSGAISWSLYSSLLVPTAEATGPHPRGALWSGTLADSSIGSMPLLSVNGRTKEVWLRRGEDLVLEMRNPPGSRPGQRARFALVYAVGDPGRSGPPVPALATALESGSNAASTGLTFVTNNLFPETLPQLVKSEPAPWASERPYPLGKELGQPGATVVLQGVIEDTQGKRALTNAVLVHWP